MAVPLAPAGATLETMEGRTASNRLKMVIRTKSQKAMARMPWPRKFSPRRPSTRAARVPRKTGFMRPLPSAWMMRGIMATMDSSRTGR
jgi:hypothetical protein